MSEEEKNNNTSSIDQVATVVVATNDDVSSSLNSALFGSSSSFGISGGSLNSTGSASAADLASAGSLGSGAESLASAYSVAAMSSLDQTYYAGSLGRSLSNAASLVSPAAATTTQLPSDVSITFPQYQVASVVNWGNNLAGYTYSNAANSGYANVATTKDGATYVGGAPTYLFQIGVKGDTTNKGHAVFNTINTLSSVAGGQTYIGAGNVLNVGGANKNGSAANFVLAYDQETGKVGQDYALSMASGSYLSATGFLGGVADKSAAGKSLAGAASSRTAPLSTADAVSIKVDGDFGQVGDVDGSYKPPITTMGANNKIKVGGNLGVFMNASMVIGSNASFAIGGITSNNGSGLFIGSGGYFSAGTGGQYYVLGGMGAAYVNTSINTSARLLLGDNNSVYLNQANWGNFAAQAGGYVSAGSNFNLRALELSVGYGQLASTGEILGSLPATMVIGNGATINLAQSGLYDNGSGFYVGQNGAITLDAIGAQVTIGSNAAITAQNISLGNYTKVYSGTDPRDGKVKAYSYYTRGSNNNITIGAGATINLSGGIALDGNNNLFTLTGGGAGNILSAGYISAGRFYKAYSVPLSGSSYVFDNTSGTTLTIGNNYNITLTSGTITTGLANEPTISNNGNVELNTVNGKFAFGDNVVINANSMVVGDYYNSTANGIFSGATQLASMTYGTSATINLSGAVLMNGESDRMSFTDHLTLNASTMSLGLGSANAAAQNTHCLCRDKCYGYPSKWSD